MNIRQLGRYSTITRGDSFTLMVKTFAADFACKEIAIVLEAPVTGMIGFCTAEIGPKDWSPKGVWPKGFKPLHAFEAPSHITIAYAGSYHTIENIMHSGQVGVWKVRRARMRTKPSGLYSYSELE